MATSIKALSGGIPPPLFFLPPPPQPNKKNFFSPPFRQDLKQPRLSYYYFHFCIRYHEREPIFRIALIQWDIRSSRLQDGNQPNYHLYPALHTDPYSYFWPYPNAAQVLS